MSQQTGEARRPQPHPPNTRVHRDEAVILLRRLGLSDDEIDDVLGGLTFPASQTELERRGQPLGITVGSMVERLGGSP